MKSNIATTTRRPAPPFGGMLKSWRARRGLSQLACALDTGVSQRHLSFLESGRARPSRDMVLHLGSALGLPLRHQNALLLAAGFAPVYGARDLAGPEMAEVNAALDRILAQQEPFPALVFDRALAVLRANGAAQGLFGFLLGLASPPATLPSFWHILLSPEGIRPFIVNWEEVVSCLLHRHKAESLIEGEGGDGALVPPVLLNYSGVAELARNIRADPVPAPILKVKLRKDAIALALFSTITTLGTPLDVTLQDIRIESFFPADAATEKFFRANR